MSMMSVINFFVYDMVAANIMKTYLSRVKGFRHLIDVIEIL